MDPTAYARHYQLDAKHFWRIAKRRLVLEWLEHYLPSAEGRKVLDIGGACSVISQQLERFGEVTVVEPDQESVAQARSELHVAAIVGALPHDLHVAGPFDVITLLDVLEHIDDDLESLKTIHGLLRPEGVFILTAPAYQWLWSEHDQVLHHRRRYSRARLRDRLSAAGFQVDRISYYTSLLFPAVAAQRLGRRLKRSPHQPAYRVQVPHRLLNATLGAVMSFERRMLRYVDLPFGSALIAVAIKRNGARPHSTEQVARA